MSDKHGRCCGRDDSREGDRSCYVLFCEIVAAAVMITDTTTMKPSKW